MNFLREIVSGPKNRMKENGYNLDLTYICPRLIAMSYPASGVESVYRNPIDKDKNKNPMKKQRICVIAKQTDLQQLNEYTCFLKIQVTKFIKENHQNNFLVFNLSGRTYNYSKFEDQSFNGKIIIHLLFTLYSKYVRRFRYSYYVRYFSYYVVIQKALVYKEKKTKLTLNINKSAKKENVCITHCLAGKGRTGTIICCFLIYSGIIETTEEALNYYSKKRFIQEGFGVNQPCQIRYLQYFHEILKNRLISPIYPKLVYIKKVIFKGRPNFNTQKGCRPYFDIIDVRTKQLIFSTKKAYSDSPKFLEGDSFEIEFGQQVMVCGDLLMRIKHNGYYKNQKIARISFNTAFIPDDGSKILKFTLEELSPSSLIKDQRFPKNFVIEIHFGQICNCTRHTPFKDKCNLCSPQLHKEKEYWEIMQRIIRNYIPLDKQVQRELLFGNPTQDDISYVLQNKSVGKQISRNVFKFDSEQDKFVQDLELAFQKKAEGKNNPDNEEAKNSNSSEQQGYSSQQYDEIISPVKIRKRSDVRHNFYSEDQSFSSKRNQINNIRINSTNNNKENMNMTSNSKQLSNSVPNNHVLNSLSHSNEVVLEKNEDCDEEENEEVENHLEDGPPSPISPKHSYVNKNENDTDLDSPYEDSHPNVPKCSQNFSQFSKGYIQKSNLLTFEKDSYDDLHYDSDDPSPQKPFAGDKIFVNNMKNQ